jgi:Mrp family chromosome partitioning ATPase
MARMLQALKNLEARSVRPKAERPAVQAAPVEPATFPAAAALEEQSPIETAGHNVAVEEVEVLVKSIEPVELPALEITPLPAWPLPTINNKLEPSEAIYVRPATNFERQVRRTLSDPVRGQPLAQLADRLRRDIEQTGGKTVLLVGVGPQSVTHEALLYAAARLAEHGQEKVLLVDADLARVPLSEAFDYGRERGLAELVRGDGLPRDLCQMTSIGRLSFLPAGQLRHDDLSTAGPRLEEVLKALSHDYACVLIDGGRTGDLTAAALARLADATYLVVQLGTVETSEAQATLRDFRAAGARVLGCIAT